MDFVSIVPCPPPAQQTPEESRGAPSSKLGKRTPNSAPREAARCCHVRHGTGIAAPSPSATRRPVGRVWHVAALQTPTRRPGIDAFGDIVAAAHAATHNTQPASGQRHRIADESSPRVAMKSVFVAVTGHETAEDAGAVPQSTVVGMSQRGVGAGPRCSSTSSVPPRAPAHPRPFRPGAKAAKKRPARGSQAPAVRKARTRSGLRPSRRTCKDTTRTVPRPAPYLCGTRNAHRAILDRACPRPNTIGQTQSGKTLVILPWL